MITKQQIYDKVKAHAKAQPHKARSPEGHCEYRNTNGTKCFVGCLIPDELYDPQMDTDGMLPIELIKNYPALVEHIGSDYGFLISLQNIHDERLVEDWPQLLSELATKYNLKP